MTYKTVEAPPENLEIDPERLYDSYQASDFLGVNVHTMRNWRFQKRGPAYFYLSANAVRYKRKDLLAFIDSKKGAAA